MTSHDLRARYLVLHSAAGIVSQKHGRPDMQDDLAQELWLDYESLERKFDPEKGTMEALLHRHAEYMLLGMLKKVKELHVEEIFEVETNPDFAVSEEMTENPENDLIEDIDRNKALERVREKLRQRGRDHLQLKVIQTYQEKIASRRASRNSRGIHDTEKRQKLISLIRLSGVSDSRFADALGIDPQRLSSYTRGIVQDIPDEIMNAAEKVIIQDVPTRMSVEEMQKWCADLFQSIGKPGDSVRRLEEYLASIVGVTRTTVMRWRKGESKLMPDKADSIKAKVTRYIKTVSI